MATTTAATPIEGILSRFYRDQIVDFIEIAIGRLDVANDPEAEYSECPIGTSMSAVI